MKCKYLPKAGKIGPMPCQGGTGRQVLPAVIFPQLITVAFSKGENL